MPTQSRLYLARYCLRHLIPLRHRDPRAKGYIYAWVQEIRRLNHCLSKGV